MQPSGHDTCFHGDCKSWRGNIMKLLDKKSKQLHESLDYDQLLFAMQTIKGERDGGVVIKEVSVKHIELLIKVNSLRKDAWYRLQRN